MKKSIRRAIQELATKLPEQFYQVANSITNQAKASIFFKASDDQKEKIDFSKPPYRIVSNHRVNHVRRMKRLFKKEGIAGINRYTKPFGISNVQLISK